MKRFFGYALLLTLAAAPAFAAKNSQSLNFAQPVQVGSTEIPAGDVKVTWTGTGDTVQVTISESGKSVTVPAKLVAEKNDHKAYVVNQAGGTAQLETLEFNNVSLKFESPAVSGQ